MSTSPRRSTDDPAHPSRKGFGTIVIRALGPPDGAPPRSSVEDYEQRVSELILAVGDLRARRRRSPRSGSQLTLLPAT